MGLLDSVLNPNTLGLMGLAQGLGQAAAPSRLPVPMGVAAAQGMQGLMGGVGSGLQTAMMLQRMKLLQGLADDGSGQSSGQASPQQSQWALQTGAQVPSQGTTGAMFSGGTAPAGAGPTNFNESLLGAAPAPSGGNSLGMTPSQMFKRGLSMSLLGLPGGGNLMDMAAKYDPATLDTAKLAALANANPADVAGAELRKQTYIAPTRLGEGAYFDPTQGVQGLPSAAPAGFINTRDQNGQWQTVPVNNGLNAAALSKGALEGAAEANKIGMVTDGSGRTVPMWMGAAAGMPPAMGGTPAIAPQSAPQTAPQPAPPSAPVTLVKSPIIPGQTASGQDPWANVPQLSMPAGLGQDTYHKSLAEDAAKHMGELATKYGTQADLANQQMAMNNDALDKLQTATTGPQAMGITEVQNFLQNRAGWDPKGSAMTAFNHFVNSPGDPSATQELNKELINSALAGAKKIYGPRITQNEVQLQIKQASPNVDQTTGAIRYLLNLGNQQAQYQINQADGLSKYRAAGGDPYAFEGWYAKNFPMTQSVGQAAMQPTKQSPVTTQAPSHGPVGLPSQSAIAAEMARRGLK